jgi:hypothetical protein
MEIQTNLYKLGVVLNILERTLLMNIMHLIVNNKILKHTLKINNLIKLIESLLNILHYFILNIMLTYDVIL